MAARAALFIAVGLGLVAASALAQPSRLSVELGVRGPTSQPLSMRHGLPAAPLAGIRFTPFRGKLSLGLEFLLTARATAVDSVSLREFSQLCAAPGGVTVICGSQRTIQKESAMQLGMALSLAVANPLFADVAAGYYSPRTESRADGWDINGGFLPSLSYQGRPRAAGGIYARVGVGARQKIGTKGLTVSGAVRYRWARVGGVFFLPDEYPDRRNGLEFVAGLGF
jgi:hypothetical protein